MTQGGTSSAEEVKPQDRKSVGTGPDSTMGQESQILSHAVPRSPPHLTTITTQTPQGPSSPETYKPAL